MRHDYRGDEGRGRTHGNAVRRRGVSEGIVRVEGLLCEAAGYTDGIVVRLFLVVRVLSETRIGEDLVDVVHGGDDSCEVGSAAREEHSSVLEDLRVEVTGSIKGVGG